MSCVACEEPEKLKELEDAKAEVGNDATAAVADKRILKWVELDAELTKHRLSLQVVAEERLKALAGVETQKSLKDALDGCLEDMLSRNKSETWRQTLSSTCKRFIATVGEDRFCDSITTKEVESYLEDLRKKDGSLVATRTKENNRLKISSFFAYCKKRKHVSVVPSPATYRDALKTDEAFKEIHFLNVEEVRELLKELDADSHYKKMMRCFILLGLYCGIRPQEFRKKVTFKGREQERFLTWGDVDLKKKVLTVSKQLSKTKNARKVPLPEAAVNWLLRWFGDDFPAKDKAVVPTWHSKKYSNLKAELSVTLTHDILRHTYGTYRTSLVGASKASTEMGNSAGVVLAHYAEAVDEQDAEDFFKLSPEKVLPSNIGNIKKTG